MEDPVVLNGNLYDRESLEEWMFEHDWKDPTDSNSKAEEEKKTDIN